MSTVMYRRYAKRGVKRSRKGVQPLLRYAFTYAHTTSENPVSVQIPFSKLSLSTQELSRPMRIRYAVVTAVCSAPGNNLQFGLHNTTSNDGTVAISKPLIVGTAPSSTYAAVSRVGDFKKHGMTDVCLDLYFSGGATGTMYVSGYVVIEWRANDWVTDIAPNTLTEVKKNVIGKSGK